MNRPKIKTEVLLLYRIALGQLLVMTFSIIFKQIVNNDMISEDNVGIYADVD